MQTATTARSGLLAKPVTAMLPWLMLPSRSLWFFMAQVLIALVIISTGAGWDWYEAARWWILFPIFANVISIALLVYLYRAEGKRYLDILRFSRQSWKTDLLWFLGSGVIGLPIAAAPMNLLGAAIFGDSTIPINTLFQPLPAWALLVGLLFPITIAFAELPTYFGYVMPRLFSGKYPWLAYFAAAIFLSLQHAFLPLLLDWNFCLWRALMFLPFALYAGLMIKLRPNLLPYFAIVHALMDLSVLAVYLML